MINIIKASVYCGTYHKYNNGSISGAWLKLADYTTKKNFLAACRELHKDESDPELMFQDWENIPTSLVSESEVDSEIWHVINSIKKYAPDRADDFAEWADENGCEADYNAFREFMDWGKKTDGEKKTENPLQMSKEEMKRVIKEHPYYGRDADYYLKNASNIALIGGKVILFQKGGIQTRFCFDDENKYGLDMYDNFYKDTEKARRYFVSVNMRCFTNHLDLFKEDVVLFDLITSERGISEVVKRIGEDELWRYNTYEIKHMTSDEIEQYRQILKFEAGKFETRLKSYLNRYGVKKCRTWTYWVNA